MSSWLLLGIPGLAYASGICDAAWTAIGLAIGTYSTGCWSPSACAITLEVCGDSVTVPDFFENRFRDKSHLLMGISSVAIVVFFVPYTASGFAACGKLLFSSLFGVNYTTAMIVSAAVIVAYTAMGGFLAASTTDFVQSIVMTAALIFMLVFGISMSGGVSQAYDFASGIPGYLSLTHLFDGETQTAVSYGGPLVHCVHAGVGPRFWNAPILLRFMGIQDPKKLKVSRRVGSIWWSSPCLLPS